MKTNNATKVIYATVLVGLLMWSIPALADLKEMQAYKEAYPGAKPKCANCHAQEHPKKADGQHELNDYGKAVLNAAGKDTKPTADTYKKVGSMENFKK